MSLDVVAASRQVRAMADQLAVQALRMRSVPAFATEQLRHWHERPEEAQTYLEGVGSAGVWPFAVPAEPLLTAVAAPPEPADYTVVATDGSQIDVDSHGLVHCYLVNVGWAALRYGALPDAWLSNRPQVLHRDEELFVNADDGQMQEVEGHLLSLLRTVAELERLAEVVAEWRDRPSLVAVADGSLVRWEFGGRAPDPARGALLHRYTLALARFRELGVPICSYISRPNAREVANALSLLALQDCACDPGSCAQCRGRREALCTVLRVLPDRAVLAHLRPGERCGLFRSQAPVLDHYAPPDRIAFFYLRLDDEMARVELPRWACEEPYLTQIHRMLYGQCRRGHGYPVVLMEAHEQAVIHGASRDAFRQLVMEALHLQDLEVAVSAKRLSKDQRAV
ncbi:MAG TPA: DNA double-strand break repair nuclease NurA [Chloroflexota bacterium]|nr:DNA double-strand break repair nuclease NurA [Chloroflexota bacterium]